MDSAILAYIQDELKKGYTIEQIKDHLIGAGYPVNTVNDNIKFLQGDLQQRRTGFTTGKTEIRKKPILITIIVCLILFLAAIFYFTYPLKEETGVDIDLNLISPSVVSGGQIVFEVKLLNLTKKKTFLVEYTITNLKTKKVILSTKSERNVLNSFVEQLDILRAAQGGSYELSVELFSDDLSLEEVVEFEIEDLTDEVKVNVSVPVKVLESKVQSIPEITKLVSVPISCNLTEISCVFSKIRTTNESKWCAQIESIESQDDCYFYLSTFRSQNNCMNVINVDRRKLCFLLQDLSAAIT